MTSAFRNTPPEMVVSIVSANVAVTIFGSKDLEVKGVAALLWHSH
jgi:hypothetical protein